MIPPRSPFGLIQEDLWPDEWKILVVCMLLNCTTRKQVEKVYPTFFSKWTTPNDFSRCNIDEVINVIKPLGFANRRSKGLKQMTNDYLHKDWTHASELFGIGEYASRAWEIFCLNHIGTIAPNDHALVKYYHWRIENEKRCSLDFSYDNIYCMQNQ